jgi:hypothetical protein
MQLCNNCKKLFDLPGRAHDSIGYTWTICPYCESEDFDHAHRCPFTGEYIPISEDYAESVYAGVASDLDEIGNALLVTDATMQRLYHDMLNRYIEERS